MACLGTAHIIGGGLAGLASAVSLASQGCRVLLYEASPFLGGRCRSYHDSTLNITIDNGSHLVLSGNDHVMGYVNMVGAQDELIVQEQSRFDFYDVPTGRCESLTVGDKSRAFWFVKREWGMTPSTLLSCLWACARHRCYGRHHVVSDVFSPHALFFRKFIDPLAVSVLNTESSKASMRLLWNVLVKTFFRGASHCRPCYPRENLGASFIAPAHAYLLRHGASIRCGMRVRGLGFQGRFVSSLCGLNFSVPVGREERVIMALPPFAARAVLPSLSVPEGYRGIINVHFLIPKGRTPPPFPSMVGMHGSRGHWLFCHKDHLSVTISAVQDSWGTERDSFVRQLWRDVSLTLGWKNGTMPPYRYLCEKRATFVQSPQNEHARGKTQTPWHNMFLAGDWTDTGLPATIEGAIMSGFRAASCVVSSVGSSSRSQTA
ncbi:MAG: FAD-dependent oxidoreductase [Alphaproteobacteria bacterium GM7ARS4]|nr:FAD-dependent oxidoreductase [Alphaproteobacteria bacterium GM7ARS4]